jgi:hypothetical protein
MQGFDIYFLGEMLPDTDPTAVRQGVAKLFKIDPARADRLFSGKALRVKHGVDAEVASRYRAAFREVGALVQIVPEGSPAPTAAETVAASRSTPEPAAMPGSEDGVAPPPTADASFTLAEPGAIIDHTPPPEPADISTDGLEALAPNSGTLEDCKVEKPPREIPDISHMKLVDD